MAQEIERKFKVRSDSFKDEATGSVVIRQGYLCSASGRTVRVRRWGGQGFITIKGPTDASGTSRFEWEQEIPADEADALLKLAEPGLIDKTRFLVPCTDGTHTWEVDEFHGDNDGLVMAEIELGAVDEPFDKPEWLGDEVTGDRRYYNSMLIKCPYKDWK